MNHDDDDDDGCIQVTLKDLSWEDKELVLRVLFAKVIHKHIIDDDDDDDTYHDDDDNAYDNYGGDDDDDNNNNDYIQINGSKEMPSTQRVHVEYDR